jgi:RNA polymerase subunit RPABC4/transcription elongation factor Spt4
LDLERPSYNTDPTTEWFGLAVVIKSMKRKTKKEDENITTEN